MALRVLLYSPTSRLEPGGTQAVVQRLAAHLRKRGHWVTEAWAAPGPEPSPDEWIRPLVADTGSSGAPAARAVFRGLASLAQLASGIAKRRPNIVNIHFLRGQTVYFLTLKKAFGYKVVLSAHGSDILNPTPACRKYLPYFCRAADAVTVVSEHLAQAVRALRGVDTRKVRVIPNGIDYAFWSSGPERRPVDDASSPTIVAAGRLERVKGFDVLLDALARLEKTFPAVRLIVAGDGALLSALKEQAAALGIADAVEFPGRLGPERLRRLYASADAFALSSWSEGMPLALLEAMAAGAPVVATRVGGVPEALAADAGLMVEPGDAAGLADALARVLRGPELASQLSQAGRSRALQYSDAASDASYEELYLQVLGARSR